MNKNLIIGLVVIAVIGVGVAWYLTSSSGVPATDSEKMMLDNTNSTGTESPTDMVDGTPTPTETVTPTPTPTETAMESPTPTPSVKSFTVSAQNFSFQPNTITVKRGDTVRITFKNVEGTHDLKIDEFSVSTKQINGGEEETVEFVASRAGTFQYYCSVGKHRAMGMWGTLTVQE